VGSGSIALLAFLPEPEIEAIIEANRRWLVEFPSFGPDAIRSFVGQTRRQGYSLIEGQMTPNINAIGVPVMDDQERPVAALSVTAIADRIRGQRAFWLATLLQAGSCVSCNLDPEIARLSRYRGCRESSICQYSNVGRSSACSNVVRGSF